MKLPIRAFFTLLMAGILLPSVLYAQRFRELSGHGLDVNSVAFSPNGELLASASSDRTIILWNTRTGAQTYVMDGHLASVNSIAFSADGNLLASGSSDGTIRIWDVKSGRQLKVYESHGRPVEQVVFGANSTNIATASWDRSARLWDIHENWEQEFLDNKNVIYSVALDPAGEYLYTAGADATITVWNINTGRRTRQLKGHTNTVRSIAISPDGKTLASASLDRSVRVWSDVSSSKGSLRGHTDIIRSVDFSPDAKLLVTASRDRSARIYDVASGNELQVLNGHTGPLWQAVFSPDGKSLATASADRTVRIWDVSHLNITAGSFEFARRDPDRFKPPVDISKNIPMRAQQSQRYALVIANEDYKKFQTSAGEIDVEFAVNDGMRFAQYAEKRLGIPRRNILVLTNGTAAQIDNEITKLSMLARNHGPGAELFFFYAGHGIPQEGTRESFLLPVDVNAFNPTQAMLLSDVIERLNEHKPERVTLFVDACFSGQTRSGTSPIAARGVIIRPKPVEMRGNTVIFSASTGEQSALPYRQAGHGLFSYFLMMILNTYPDGIAYGDLAERLEGEVSLHALLLFNKSQTPTIQASPGLEDRWKDWDL